MTDPDDNVLRRWSRLKRAQTAPAPSSHGGATPSLPDTATDQPSTAAPTSSIADMPTKTEQPPPVDETALPDPTTLSKDDDFTRYLAEGISPALRRQALRALWRSDPVLANLDGLNDYDENYTTIGTVARTIETAYRVGRGHLADDETDTKPATKPDAPLNDREPSETRSASANEDEPKEQTVMRSEEESQPPADQLTDEKYGK